MLDPLNVIISCLLPMSTSTWTNLPSSSPIILTSTSTHQNMKNTVLQLHLKKELCYSWYKANAVWKLQLLRKVCPQNPGRHSLMLFHRAQLFLICKDHTNNIPSPLTIIVVTVPVQQEFTATFVWIATQVFCIIWIQVT
jgi:hypothetical protein